MDRLQEILSTMLVPANMKTNYGWLVTKLSIKNKLHPNLEEALGLARQKLIEQRTMKKRVKPIDVQGKENPKAGESA